MKLLPPIQSSAVDRKTNRIKSRLSTFAHKHWLFAVDLRFKLTNLVADFIEGLLQLSMDSCQLFEVFVSFMDGEQNLVHFINGLIHGTLHILR